MPCFAMQIRRLKIKMPDSVSLFDDADQIESELKKKLSVDTHEDLHEKIEEMDQEELKEILEEILEKLKKQNPPDRMTEQREKALEVFS